MNNNYDPNARFDHGPNAAGCGRDTNDTLNTQVRLGLQVDGTLGSGHTRTGTNVAGNLYRNRINIGPNAAGQPRSVNGV